jgi:hypothetical protein
MNRNLQQRMRAVMYQLKMQYGDSIAIHKKTSVSSNARTGEKVMETSVTRIRRAVIVTGEIARREHRSISAISANKGLVQGGWYDTNTRYFIIDRRDARNLTLTNDDFIIYSGLKYQVAEFREFETRAAWIVTGQAVLGAIPSQNIAGPATTPVDVQQSVEGEVS